MCACVWCMCVVYIHACSQMLTSVCAGQRIVSSVLLYHCASYSFKIVSLEQDRQVATPNAPPVSSSPKC